MSGTLAETSLSPIRHFFRAQTLEETGKGRVETFDSVVPTEKTGPSGEFYAFLLNNPFILSQIQSFAHRPQDWIHESRFSNGAFALQTDNFSDRLEVKVASGISRTFNLTELNYEEFEHRPFRLALLDFDSLDRLSVNLGLVNLIHRFDPTNHTQRTAIADQLGEINFSNLAGLASEPNFRATAKIPKDWTEDVDQAAAIIGWATLGTVFAEAPKSILKRFELKLTRGAAKKFKSGRKKPFVDAGFAGHLAVHIFQQTEVTTKLTCIF